MPQIVSLLLTFASLFTPKTNGHDSYWTRHDSDSTISLFGNFRLTLSIFDAAKLNDFYSTKNATVTLVQNQNGKVTKVFVDSLFCGNNIMKLADFNNDGVKDILIFYDYDVRGNEMYHLYLLDSKKKQLVRVKDFEEVKNPKFNPSKNIIESHVVSGRNYFTYYRISKSNKLIDSNKVIYE